MRRLTDWMWRLEYAAQRHPVRANLIFAFLVACVVLMFVLVPVVVEPDASLELWGVGGALAVGLGAGALGYVVTKFFGPLTDERDRRSHRWGAAIAVSGVGSLTVGLIAWQLGADATIVALLVAAAFILGLYLNMIVRKRHAERHPREET